MKIVDIVLVSASVFLAYLSGSVFLGDNRQDKARLVNAKVQIQAKLKELSARGMVSPDVVVMSLYAKEIQLCSSCYGLLEKPARLKSGIVSTPVISSFWRGNVSYIIFYGTQHHFRGENYFEFKPAYYIESQYRLRRIDTNSTQVAEVSGWALVSLADTETYRQSLKHFRESALDSW